MSRDLYVYSLDLERLRSLQGSRDLDFLNRLLEIKKERIQKHDDYFRQVLDMDSLFPLQKALEQIICNQIDDGVVPLFQFEHAVALLASSLGKPLGSELMLDVKSALWDEVDSTVRIKLRMAGLAESALPTFGEILKRGPLLEIPIDPDLPLGSGYLWKDEVQHYVRIAEAVDVDDTFGLEELTWPDEAL